MLWAQENAPTHMWGVMDLSLGGGGGGAGGCVMKFNEI